VCGVFFASSKKPILLWTIKRWQYAKMVTDIQAKDIRDRMLTRNKEN
jgi:hypothetical protein